MPRSSFFRWCMTSYAGWRRRSLGVRAPGQTLQATALVHEAYMRLVQSEQRAPRLRGTAAAIFSRRRRKPCDGFSWNGRDTRKVSRGAAATTGKNWTTSRFPPRCPTIDLIALDIALDRLESTDKRKAQLVKLRFFAGLTIEEVGASPRHLDINRG